MIPKIIMQTWKTLDVPEHWKPSQEALKKYMPDWEYVLMTDEMNREFVKKHFDWYLPYYDAFPYPIQRADVIRYMWLFVFGGIYIDLDIQIQQSLEPLLELEKKTDEKFIFLVRSANIGSCYTNSLMASDPGCEFWVRCLKESIQKLPWWTYGKHLQVMNSTGPVMLNYVANQETRLNLYEKELILELPRRAVLPCSVCEIGDIKKCEGAYTRPLEGSSWISWDTKVYLFFLCNYPIIIIFTLLMIFIFYIWWLNKN